MKAIISHDIDHLTVWEHTTDLILPKFVVRANMELVMGKISINEYVLRIGDFFKNKWQRIDEVIAFNESMGVPSSFFIGVNNGLGLSYPLKEAAFWIDKVARQKVEIGVHGINYDTLEGIQKEYADFKSCSTAITSFGIRMHYVRQNEHTLQYIEKCGYLYDSTEHSFKNPYKIGNMWEFPFQIMDGWVIDKDKRWQSQNLEQAKNNTLTLIEKAHRENLEYLGIIFHDRYFCDSFKTWKNWYIWLVEYLKENKIGFVNFHQAIQHLENKKNEAAHTNTILST